MSKRIAIVQSSYIPWKGYFDLIRAVDEFVLLDDVQFTKRDWRTRNRIKTVHGPAWLTIPVQNKGRYLQLIQETRVADDQWGDRHWATLKVAYGRAPHFHEYETVLAPLFAPRPSAELISTINLQFTQAICELLGIRTPIVSSAVYNAPAGKNERLVEICRRAGATDYLSGPSAQGYIDEEQFAQAGVRVSFANYDGYPEYPQVHPPFEHAVSVLDLLFCTGVDALKYMKRL